jgi:hypothetical protein
MWSVHRLDRINAKKPAKLLDSKSLTLGFSGSRFGRFFYVSRSCRLQQSRSQLLRECVVIKATLPRLLCRIEIPKRVYAHQLITSSVAEAKVTIEERGNLLGPLKSGVRTLRGGKHLPGCRPARLWAARLGPISPPDSEVWRLERHLHSGTRALVAVRDREL